MALSSNDAKIIIGMVNRGDPQHDVAAWFGVNQARIVEALNGDYGTREAAPANQLPPKGAPGLKARKLKAFVEKALNALNQSNQNDCKKYLEDGLKSFNNNQ